MSGWLARSSQRGEAFMSRFRGTSPLKDKEVDAGACFESFRTHWQQAWDMMQAHQTADSITADDVNCVLNHVDQVVTLLLWDLKAADEAGDDAEQAAGGLRIFDLFLSERVLERLLAWSRLCGAFEDLLRLEQLRIYEQLLRQSAGALLAHRAVLRPLTELLRSCGHSEPVELHLRLVLVLGQLCAALHRQPDLLDLFVSLEPDGTASSFVIFSMLVDFVHRDGVIGQTAREALLLCMQLSSGNEQLARYIVQYSNFCPVLATGLSGLYSVLPRKLLVISEDRYQLLSSDSKQVPELHSFVISLDFCNAVLLVCHPLIAVQLLDYVYQGFLVSVMGPALHQNSMEEIITATAYLDLFLRSIDHPGLVRTFLRLILAHRYDERRIIDTLVQRIAATSKLCVVTLSLLHTLLDLNCEDVMLELVFRHLLPCTHVMVSQRTRLREPDLYGDTAQRLLALVPACCAPARPPPPPAPPPPPPAQTESGPPAAAQFALQSPLSGYFEYTLEARARVQACRRGCAVWTYAYDGAHPAPADVYRMLRAAGSPPPPPAEPAEPTAAASELADEADSIGESSGYQSFNPRLSPSPPPGEPEDALFWSLLRRSASPPAAASLEASCAELDAALLSLGVPAGPERTPPAAEPTEPELRVPPPPPPPPPAGQPPETEEAREQPQSPTEMFGVSMGPFLWLLLERLEEATTNGFQLNLQLMTVISRLSQYPQPLLRSFLLDHSIVLQPSVRSLLQTLGTLKQRIDLATASLPHAPELVRWARGRLAAREELPGSPAASLGSTGSGGSLSKAEPRRLSLNSVASMLRRSLGGSGGGAERPTSSSLEPIADGSGFRYTPRPARAPPSSAAVEDAAGRRLAMAAVLLEQWLQELAAIAQEHAVAADRLVFAL